MKALRWLEKAIALDRNFAQAYALLAWTFFWRRGITGV
jgi:hypothetical protein